jgi:hypothetical protein
MQLTKTIFPESATSIEKKRVENRLWRKSEFLWRKNNISFTSWVLLNRQTIVLQSYKREQYPFQNIKGTLQVCVTVRPFIIMIIINKSCERLLNNRKCFMYY